MKRVLIITQYFYPENFKSNDIAFELAKKGYGVDVLCGIPNYPDGEYFRGYGLFKKRFENINGVNVFRSFQIARGKNNSIRLALNYLSYAFFASLWILFYFIWRKYDVIFVHEPSPITQGIPAVLLKKIKRIPLYFWVLDIWPDAMTSGGGIKNKKILSLVDSLVRFIYNNCDRILISSRGFESLILNKGDYQDKIVYYPNWSEDILSMSQDYSTPELPDGFLIMVAGNLGKSQNPEAIIEAAKLTSSNKTIKWIFIGDGSKKQWIDYAIENYSLHETVFTYGRFPFEAMPKLFSHANAMLLTLKAEYPHLKQVVPARLQSYMAASVPVLGMIDGGGADIIQESDCGYVVPAGDYNELVRVLNETVLTDLDSFKVKGQNGRRYYEDNFRKETCIENLVDIFNWNERG